MCSHYLVEPVACSPGAGWEKGQVENQVGTLRQRLFTPRPRVATLDELNAWLRSEVVTWAQGALHPERRDLTVWEVFQAERPSADCDHGAVRRLPGGDHGQRVEDLPDPLRSQPLQRGGGRGRQAGAGVAAYADRIVVWCNGQRVGEHRHCSGATPRSPIRCITCRSSPASRGHCAMEHGSGNGSYRRPWPG